MIKVGIVGASGFTGQELVSWLNKHPDVSLEVFTSKNHQGIGVEDYYKQQGLVINSNQKFVDTNTDNLLDCDVVFFASPNGVAMQLAKDLINNKIRIIDISADFRIQNVDTWEKWYGQKHACPDLINEAVYGLPELKDQTQRISKASVVANPGCYPTASLLSLLPLVDIISKQRIIINATSGITGAGRNPDPERLFQKGSDNYQAYAVAKHRHYPEMLDQIHQVNQNIDLLFVPHLSSMQRGIYATHYVTVKDLNLNNLFEMYQNYYDKFKFIEIFKEQYPKVSDVNNTNKCQISLFSSSQDNSDSNLVIMSCIDNLVKGASGQAIQNMNIMFNLEETTGLL